MYYRCTTDEQASYQSVCLLFSENSFLVCPNILVGHISDIYQKDRHREIFDLNANSRQPDGDSEWKHRANQPRSK